MNKLTLIILFGYLMSVMSCRDSLGGLNEELKFKINVSENSLGLSSYRLPAIDAPLSDYPQHPKNPLTEEKIELGKMLFYETAFATVSQFDHSMGTYSCASCHNSDAGFQSNMMQAIGDGGMGYGHAGESRKVDYLSELKNIDVQMVRTPSILHSSYQPHLGWTGDCGMLNYDQGTITSDQAHDIQYMIDHYEMAGIEAQTLAEVYVHRFDYSAVRVKELGYDKYFDAAFPNSDEDNRYNAITAALALAAYQRTIVASQSPFQRWLHGDYDAMTAQEKEGAILFFDKARCINCHYGPGLAAMDFENIGLTHFEESKVLNWNPEDLRLQGRYAVTNNDEDLYRFKVPQLYNLKNSPFYGHGASYGSIGDIIRYKNEASPQDTDMDTDLLSKYFVSLDLSVAEIDLLTLFVEESLYDPDLHRYEPEAVLSHNCFPNNDYQSRKDLGCQ